jgi:hypothetical protein
LIFPLMPTPDQKDNTAVSHKKILFFGILAVLILLLGFGGSWFLGSSLKDQKALGFRDNASESHFSGSFLSASSFQTQPDGWCTQTQSRCVRYASNSINTNPPTTSTSDPDSDRYCNQKINGKCYWGQTYGGTWVTYEQEINGLVRDHVFIPSKASHTQVILKGNQRDTTYPGCGGEPWGPCSTTGNAVYGGSFLPGVEYAVRNFYGTKEKDASYMGLWRPNWKEIHAAGHEILWQATHSKASNTPFDFAPDANCYRSSGIPMGNVTYLVDHGYTYPRDPSREAELCYLDKDKPIYFNVAPVGTEGDKCGQTGTFEGKQVLFQCRVRLSDETY